MEFCLLSLWYSYYNNHVMVSEVSHAVISYQLTLILAIQLQNLLYAFWFVVGLG